MTFLALSARTTRGQNEFIDQSLALFGKAGSAGFLFGQAERFQSVSRFGRDHQAGARAACPDRATPELTKLTARLGSMMPYRPAASVLAEFLPVEPTETYATVRKRTIRIGERLDNQIPEEERHARSQTDERRRLEMQLPGDRRKEFVVSIDTAHVHSAERNSERNFELVVARCGRGGRGEGGGRYFVTSSTDQRAIRDRALHALREVGHRGFGDVTVISDGAEILKRLPRALPKPTAHIIDWFHIAMKIQPMQQIADQIARSRSGLCEAFPTIDRDIRALKWRLWHGRVDRAIRDLERLLASLKDSRQESEFSIVRLHSLGAQLLISVLFTHSFSVWLVRPILDEIDMIADQREDVHVRDPTPVARLAGALPGKTCSSSCS